MTDPDVDAALSRYTGAQLRLKRLTEKNREVKEQITTAMEAHAATLKKFLADSEVDCVPCLTDAENNPLYLRLETKQKYLPITEAEIKSIVETAITFDLLQPYYEELLATKEPPKKKRRGEAKGKPVVSTAEVLAAAVQDQVLQELTAPTSVVKVSKTKKRGYKPDLDHPVAIPEDVKKMAHELMQHEATLKELREKAMDEKRRCEDIKEETLPIISQRMAPDQKHEVDVTDSRGQVKTYVMTATAVKGKDGGPKSDAAAKVRAPPVPKLSSKTFCDSLPDICQGQQKWCTTSFEECKVLWKSDQELQQEVQRVLVEQLKAIVETKRAESMGKKKEGGDGGGGHNEPVSIKMRMKSRGNDDE